MIATGYWGVPGGGERTVSKVHIAINDRPLCGARFGRKQQFQWCAAGVFLSYVECRQCYRLSRHLVRAMLRVHEAQAALQRYGRRRAEAGAP